MWANSLNIDGLHCNNLYEESKDGLALLKILEKILPPGSVDWKKVEQPKEGKSLHKLK